MSTLVLLPLLVPLTAIVLKHLLNVVGEKRANQIASGGVYRISIALRTFNLVGACFLTWIVLSGYVHGYFSQPRAIPFAIFGFALIPFSWLGAAESFLYRVRLTENKVEVACFSTKCARYSEITKIRLVQRRVSKVIVIEYARNGILKLSDQLQLFDKLCAYLQDHVNKGQLSSLRSLPTPPLSK